MFVRLRSAMLVLLSFLLCFLTACTPAYQTVYGFAMNSTVTVTTPNTAVANSLLPLASEAENSLSAHLPTSDIARLNAGGTVALSLELYRLLVQCEQLRTATGGAFSVLSLPLTSLWQFDADAFVPPTEQARLSALQTVAASYLVLNEETHTASLSGGGIDLGAVGKGYACDVLASALREKGQNGIIAVGGSIAAVGEKSQGKGWQIGVRDPFSENTNQTVGMLTLTDSYVSTSGSYEKTAVYQGVKYHHILDMQTGLPVDTSLVSVTVVAPTGALSDMLSTALFALGIEEGIALCRTFSAQALFVTDDGNITLTDGMQSLFTYTGKGQVTVK